MALACSRMARRIPISSIKAALNSNVRNSSFCRSASIFTTPSNSTFTPLLRSFLIRTRMPTVNVATSQCGSGGQNDVLFERYFSELSSAFSGHIVNLEFAGPANHGPMLHYQSLVYQFQGDQLEERTMPLKFRKAEFEVLLY
ncbi:uncharacterized protein LOC129311817 isoform X2 [Prosopis cineraria]|uniref:uncharacterized protein LOC129311817 isoform X2 n=1 Tax=Prosopis cineraria TaxID=364024 RepID=UPI002410767A|nr:uncharacterized protein LOC129311817 isoform X2 [Prosopis cineraria]